MQWLVASHHSFHLQESLILLYWLTLNLIHLATSLLNQAKRESTSSSMNRVLVATPWKMQSVAEAVTAKGSCCCCRFRENSIYFFSLYFFSHTQLFYCLKETTTCDSVSALERRSNSRCIFFHSWKKKFHRLTFFLSPHLLLLLLQVSFSSRTLLFTSVWTQIITSAPSLTSSPSPSTSRLQWKSQTLNCRLRR